MEKKNLTTYETYETYDKKHGDILHISPGISSINSISKAWYFFQPPDFHLQHGGL